MNLNLHVNALAYAASNPPANDPLSPCICSLVYRCDDAKLATLLLVLRLPTAHGTTDSEFVLQYDGDNLVPFHVKLVTGKGRLEQPMLDQLVPLKGKGKKRLDVKTLQLSVKQLPPVWCPADVPAVSPKPGCELALQCMVGLAKATRVEVVFDFNQLHQHHHGSFKAFSKAARGLSGYPVEASLLDRGLKKASWQVFAPMEMAGAPPAYEDSRARKRPRQDSSTPPPARCWTPTTPTAESFTSDKTVPVSPETEAAALRHAQPQYQTNVIYKIMKKEMAAQLERLNASQAEAIEAAVSKRVDAYLNGPLHAERVDAAVDRRVDAAVKARLPRAVQDLLVHTKWPTSPTKYSTYDARGNRYRKLPPLSPIGKMFLPYLRTHLTNQLRLSQRRQIQRFEKQVHAAFHEVQTEADENRAREQFEWEEERDNHRSDYLQIQVDTTNELRSQCDQMLEEGKRICDELGEKLSEELNDQVLGLVDKINKLNKYSLRKLVAAEIRKLPDQQRRKKGIPKGFGRNLLTHPDPKLLMRQVVQDSEWEDV
ncbi:hypothetical protein NX059_012373 [Plenodomus lindquistii]|nr:hypothetical protein NX059_012373 [Plenodomus lindquistii]